MQQLPSFRVVVLSAVLSFAAILLASLLALAGVGGQAALTVWLLIALIGAAVGLGVVLVGLNGIKMKLGAEPRELRGLICQILQLVQSPAQDSDSVLTLLNRLQENASARVERDLFNTRIRQAVDSANTNIMIADAERNVVYMNDAVLQMLRDAESEIRKDLPNFSAETVLGGSIDRFHKNPAHQMGMLGSLRDTHKAEIKLGLSTFGLIANPIFGESGERLGTVVEWTDRTKELELEALAVFNTRIRQATDSANTNIMIADAERNVVYMNEAVLQMLRDAESEIRKDLPNFSADTVLGGSIDRFHKNPAHQMGMLNNLQGTHRAQITLGQNTFSLIANPIFSASGERLGTVVEWKDRTKELEAENLAIFNTRIRQATDSANTNIMIADAERTVVYMNEAVLQMLRDAESEIRKDLPNFSADTVLGGSIDRFHKNPAHQMGMLNSLKGTHRAQITLGQNTFSLIANPIFSEAGERLGTVVEWKDRTKELEAENLAIFNTRIRQAIDNSSNNIMIADENRDVVYMNRAVENMLRHSEAQIKRGLPNFAVDKVLGGSIDRFHKNPAHQMGMLSSLQGTHRAQIVLGDSTFGLIANPVFAPDGSRLGTVVEWLDRTEELKASDAVTSLVAAAGAGDFSQRIDSEGKQGFFLELATGLNQLMETSDKGLKDIARVLGAIAEGNLTEKVSAEYQGTFLELKNFCNSTTDNLSAMIGEIRGASGTIMTASSEIAQGNADLSSRTEQQASSLEETASSIEQLTSTVRTNTDNAKQANVLAEQATDIATEGGDLIRQVVTTMESINESARKISDIIGVIDGIAFQTNILALNAAVEAARAGEQGRGFAVVATEVRTLAQRSAEAAKDIKQLISDSVSKIEGGNTLVNKSGETMTEIVTAIKRVNDIMAEIAAASVEQASGIEEVNTAVGQMDEMTQQNAALVEQAAAAAESLRSQTEGLQRQVSAFKLDESDAEVIAAPPPKARKETSPAKAVKATERKTESKPAKARTGRKVDAPDHDDDGDWESF